MLTKKINKKQVEEFLLKNPNFFCETPKILSVLNFPSSKKDKTKNVVSFKDWIISNLKSQKKKLLKMQNIIISHNKKFTMLCNRNY